MAVPRPCAHSFCGKGPTCNIAKGDARKDWSAASETDRCKPVFPSMEEWTGDDLLLDFYRLHYSGTLALPSIPAKRIKEYNILFHAAEQATSDTELIRQMRSFAYAFRCFLNDKDGKRLRLRNEQSSTKRH